MDTKLFEHVPDSVGIIRMACPCGGYSEHYREDLRCRWCDKAGADSGAHDIGNDCPQFEPPMGTIVLEVPAGHEPRFRLV